MSENETEKKLSPAQWHAIESLLSTGDTLAAAKAANVGRSTLYRWMREPSFAAAMRQVEAAAVANLSRSLAGLSQAAAQSLRDALEPTEKITVRLRAAEVIIGSLLKVRELVELEDRVRNLEINQ